MFCGSTACAVMHNIAQEKDKTPVLYKWKSDKVVRCQMVIGAVMLEALFFC